MLIYCKDNYVFEKSKYNRKFLTVNSKVFETLNNKKRKTKKLSGSKIMKI